MQNCAKYGAKWSEQKFGISKQCHKKHKKNREELNRNNLILQKKI